MKTLASIFVLGFLVSACGQPGWSPAELVLTKPAVATGATWSCSDADLMCVNFDSGYSGWTETGEAGTSTINENDTDFPSGTCDGSNAKSLKLSRNDANTPKDLYTITSSGTLYGLCWLKITRTAAQTSATVIMAQDGSVQRWSLQFTNAASGDLQFIVTHYNQASSQTTDYLGFFTANTWHKIEWKWVKNQASGGIYFKVNDVTQTIADTSTRDDSLVNFYVQTPSSSGTGWSVGIDNIKISSSAAPTCASP